MTEEPGTAASTPQDQPHPAEGPGAGIPLEGLPSVELPSVPDKDFTAWAEGRRRKRIRSEVYGGILLLLLGVILSLVSQRTAFLLLALLAVGGVGAYEFLVSSLE
jgi:hypothetical protein